MFCADRRPKPGLHASKKPARQGFRVVASATRTPGMRYYGYRYYNPDLGRWVNRDPIGARGGLNFYAFTANAPLVGVDILGLTGWVFSQKSVYAVPNAVVNWGIEVTQVIDPLPAGHEQIWQVMYEEWEGLNSADCEEQSGSTHMRDVVDKIQGIAGARFEITDDQYHGASGDWCWYISIRIGVIGMNKPGDIRTFTGSMEIIDEAEALDMLANIQDPKLAWKIVHNYTNRENCKRCCKLLPNWESVKPSYGPGKDGNY